MIHILIILLINIGLDIYVLFNILVSFTDALDKAKRGLYTSDLDDLDAQTTSNKQTKSIVTEKQHKSSKPSGRLHLLFSIKT